MLEFPFKIPILYQYDLFLDWQNQGYKKLRSKKLFLILIPY